MLDSVIKGGSAPSWAMQGRAVYWCRITMNAKKLLELPERLWLSADDKRKLLQDIRYAPTWIAPILRRVAGPEAV